jgi:hypothetical protein
MICQAKSNGPLLDERTFASHLADWKRAEQSAARFSPT